MDFTFDFIHMFGVGLFYASPLLLTLALVIVVLGHLVGRLEGWTGLESLYFSFITATTIGYGDFRPRRHLARVLSILIGFVGLIFTGILVALAIRAATHAFKDTIGIEELMEKSNAQHIPDQRPTLPRLGL